MRGILALCDLRDWKATGVHFAALTTAASAASPLLGIAPSPQKTPARKIISQTLNHLLYAVVAGAVVDAIFKGKKS